MPGPIGTVPGYYEKGLVSDGDPAVAFGPRPGLGGFSWAEGSRLSHANLTANLGATRSDQTFSGATTSMTANALCAASPDSRRSAASSFQRFATDSGAGPDAGNW